MALKTAKMFKDFIISANADNSAVMFTMRDAVDILAKNDNFASEVLVKSVSGVDFFDYRYITFDGEAVFEITDVVKNGNYYMFSVQYLSNITFDKMDENFYVDGVSAKTLQKLGIDLSEFVSILGKNSDYVKLDYVNNDKKTDKASYFIFAVKITFSEPPQNLRGVQIGADGSFQLLSEGAAPLKSNRTANIYAEDTEDANVDISAFETVNSGYTAYIPFPTYRYTRMAASCKESGLYSEDGLYQLTVSDFLETLNSLITDLTTSINFVLLSLKNLLTFPASYDAEKFLTITPPISNTSPAKFVFRYSNASTTSGLAQAFGGCLYYVSASLRYPIIFVSLSYVGKETEDVPEGVAVVNRPTKLYVRNSKDINKVFTQLLLLGNEIPLVDLRKDYVLIYEKNNNLRVFVDFEKNVYVDIETSIEYVKDAYSNYEAYKKANIDLVQTQQARALRQQQQQQWETFTAKNTAQGVSTLLNMIFNPLGAIKGAADYASNSITNTMLLNMMQENERANLKLAQVQEHERARATILPASELNGSLTFASAVFNKNAMRDNTEAVTLFALRYANITNDITFHSLERYIFDNDINDKVQDVADIKLPTWQKLHNYYKAYLKNTNPKNNRKALTVYAFGGTQQQQAKNAQFVVGQRGLPKIDADTGFVTNLANNGGAGITFSFNSSYATHAGITVYITARKYGPHAFNDVWVARYYSKQNPNYTRFPNNPTIPQGNIDTEWTKSYPLYLGKIPIYKGHNSIEVTISVLGVRDGSGNVDKIEIDTDAILTFADYDNE